MEVTETMVIQVISDRAGNIAINAGPKAIYLTRAQAEALRDVLIARLRK